MIPIPHGCGWVEQATAKQVEEGGVLICGGCKGNIDLRVYRDLMRVLTNT